MSVLRPIDAVPGVCFFHKGEPDYERYGFADAGRWRCTAPCCIVAWEQWRERRVQQQLRLDAAVRRSSRPRRRKLKQVLRRAV